MKMRIGDETELEVNGHEHLIDLARQQVHFRAVRQNVVQLHHPQLHSHISVTLT